VRTCIYRGQYSCVSKKMASLLFQSIETDFMKPATRRGGFIRHINIDLAERDFQ
jgi:hypothetical protein